MENENKLIDVDAAKRRIIAFATGCHTTVLTVETVIMMLNQEPINTENVRLTAALEALKIDKLNLISMVEQLENSYQQLQEINDRTFKANQAMGQDLQVMKAELEKVRAERDAMGAFLKKLGCCDNCKYSFVMADEDPCKSCLNNKDFPKWEWRGVKDINVPTKEES